MIYFLRKYSQKIFSHSLFKTSLAYSVADAINKGIPFLLLPLLTHYLLPADYGIVTNFNVYVAILAIFIGLSLNGALAVNFFKLSKEEVAVYISNTIFLIFGSFVFFLLLVFVFYKQIASFLPVPVEYIIAGAFIALGQGITAINLDLWRLQEKAISFGIYEITQTIVNVALSIYLIVSFGLGWRGRIDAYILAAVLYGFFSIIFIYKRGYFKFTINKEYLKDALKFGVPLLPHALSMWVRSGIDRIYITHFYGESETGIYATGFQFGLLISFVILAFNNAFSPYLFRSLSIADEAELAIKKIKLVKFTYAYFVVSIIVCVIATLASYFVVDHFLSVNYVKAKQFIPWAMLAQTFQGMYFMVGLYVFYVKKTGKFAIITFSCSLLQILFSYISIKQFGPLGAAYSTALISFVNFIAVWIFSSRVYKMPWSLSS